MIFPQTLAEIQRLIDDEVQESLHLDYKDSGSVSKNDSKKAEIGKDVSAFANSDGGTLIYGIREDGHLPKEINGVDHNTFKREWFDQIIRTNISPIIPDVEIVQIPVNAATSVFVVRVSKSYRSPHQAKDKRYYRRFNFESVPMEDYEINDVRNRRHVIPPLINITPIIDPNRTVIIEVSNVGKDIAKDIIFEVSEELMRWVEERDIRPFKEGIKILAPQEKRSFRYGFVAQIFGEHSKYPSQFELTVNYIHSANEQKMTETFFIDIKSFFNSKIERNSIYIYGEKIEQELKNLTQEVKNLNSTLSRLTKISGATGLNLSITTLRNIKRVNRDEELEKVDPTGQNYLFFKELLAIDLDLAENLEEFFWRGNKAQGLTNVIGITQEIIKQIEEYFILEGEIS